MPRYVYDHIRPGHGYEPGQVVSEEFARGHLSLVREVPDEKPAVPGKAADSTPAPEAAKESE